MSPLILVLLTSCTLLMQMSVVCNLILLGDRLDSDSAMDFLDKAVVGLIGPCYLS